MSNYKKLVFLFGLLVSLNQCAFGAAAADPVDATRLSPSIRKVQDGLYTAEIEPGLWFVLEEQTKESVEAWSKYYETQNTCAEKLVLEVDKYPAALSGIIKGLSGGLIGFKAALDNFMEGKSRQFWVAYAVHSDECPTAPYANSPLNKAEMTFTVTTDPDMPFTSHMGISRSATYLEAHSQTPAGHPMHRRISTLLHAFVGHVTHALMPDKAYMITAPMLDEQRMIVESLHTEDVWLGDSCCYESKDPDMLTSVAKVGRESEAVQRVLDKKYSPITYGGLSYRMYKDIISGGDRARFSEGDSYSKEGFCWQLFDGERLIWDVKALDADKALKGERAYALEWFLKDSFSAWNTGYGNSDALTVRLSALAAAFDSGLAERLEKRARKISGGGAATA